MEIRFVVNRIRRRLRSRVRVREVLRKAVWLEFENESILNFLVKYNIVTHCQQPPVKTGPRIQDFVGFENEPRFIINVIESSHS
jgi:hypothetical protein